MIQFYEYHPGSFLKNIISYRKIKKKTLAKQLDIEQSNLSEYLAGKRNFTAKFAIKLEAALKSPTAIFYLSMQINYDLALERSKVK